MLSSRATRRNEDREAAHDADSRITQGSLLKDCRHRQDALYDVPGFGGLEPSILTAT